MLETRFRWCLYGSVLLHLICLWLFRYIPQPRIVSLFPISLLPIEASSAGEDQSSQPKQAAGQRQSARGVPAAARQPQSSDTPQATETPGITSEITPFAEGDLKGSAGVSGGTAGAGSSSSTSGGTSSGSGGLAGAGTGSER